MVSVSVSAGEWHLRFTTKGNESSDTLTRLYGMLKETLEMGARAQHPVVIRPIALSPVACALTPNRSSQQIQHSILQAFSLRHLS